MGKEKLRVCVCVFQFVFTHQVLESLGSLAGTGAGNKAWGEAGGGGRRARWCGAAAGSAQRTAGGRAVASLILWGREMGLLSSIHWYFKKKIKFKLGDFAHLLNNCASHLLAPSTGHFLFCRCLFCWCCLLFGTFVWVQANSLHLQ